MSGQAVDEPEGEDRRAERDGDRETARPRDRARVDAPSPWHVEHAETSRKQTDERRRRGGQRKREQSGTHQEKRGRRQRGHDSEGWHSALQDVSQPALMLYLTGIMRPIATH